MVQAVQDQGMQTGIAGQHFPGISGGRITVEYALDVFTDADGFALEIIKTYRGILYEIECNVIPGKFADI